MKLTRPLLALTTALLAPAALVAAAPQAQAQTLADALAQAYANNPALLAARANLRAVDENVPAGAGRLAADGVGVQQLPATPIVRTRAAGQWVRPGNRRDAPVRHDSASRPARRSAPPSRSPSRVFRGGRTVATTRRAENQVLAQRARLLAQEQQVMQDTVNAYVNVIQRPGIAAAERSTTSRC